VSSDMECYLRSSVPSLITVNASSMVEQVNQAVSRLQVAATDSYDSITILSMYWASDNTGSKKDSELFLNTLSNLGPTGTVEILNDASTLDLVMKYREMSGLLTGHRRLFILHYAGHAVPGSTTRDLTLVPKIGQEKDEGPTFDFSLVKAMLKGDAAVNSGLDVLFVMDCCCAAIGGRGGTVGARVELMAATSPGGISNARVDGDTFTQDWCKAFDKLSAGGDPFTCYDIINEVNSGLKIEQYGRLFVLQEGWDLPITFRSPKGQTTLSPKVLVRSLVMAFHIMEGHDSEQFLRLIEFLKKSPVPLTVLAALQECSTLLLLRAPAFLQNFLTIPHIVFNMG